jgi:high-affinity iron transporter
LFGTALIVFRETLEAALFVGIVAAATAGLTRRARWLTGGVAAGVVGALLLASLAGQASAWADGVGQDLVNIVILALALMMLLWHCIWVSTHGREMAKQAKSLGTSVQRGQRPPLALLAAVALAVLREGAETVLFVAGYASGSGLQEIMTGVLVGLAGGIALGALMYAGLSRIPAHRLFAVTNVLVALLAAAIASQLARALLQAGLVERWSDALWDTSWLLAPESALGTLAHALVGYDARPSGLQLLFWVGTVALIVFGTRLAARGGRPGAAGTRPAT